MKLTKQNHEVTSTLIKEHDRFVVTINKGKYTREIPFHILGGAEAYTFFIKSPPHNAPIQREET